VNFYPHHIGDYAQATRHLTMLEHGAYRTLLDLYYSREAPLPLDVATVQRLACARSKDEAKAVEVVLWEFFTETVGGWRHGRCDREIEAGKRKQDAARENGKKGGRKPRGSAPPNPEATQQEPSGLSLGTPAETGCKTPNPNPNPNPNTSDDLTIIVGSGGEPTPKSWVAWAAWWREARGIEVGPSNVHDRKRFVPLAQRWIDAGITGAQMRRALDRAEATATEPIAYLPAYVDRVLASEQAPPNARDAETAEFLGALTGGLAGKKRPDPTTIEAEDAQFRRIA
jgi:uncharacterized protein YdaU (DUF1376 family)